MRAVIDASFCLAFLLRDFPADQLKEADEVIHRLRERDCAAMVPMLFPFEVANVVCVARQRRRLDEAESHTQLKAIERLPYEIVVPLPIQAVAALARKHNLTFYDASYLELALRERAEYLFTFDTAVREAAARENISTRLHD